MNWNDFERKKYDELIVDQMRDGIMLISLLAVTMFPLFIFLDWFTQPEHFPQLALIRGIASFTFLFLFVYLKQKDTFNIWIISYLSATLATIFITAQCMILGGFIGLYYTGIPMVMMAVVILLPLTVQRAAIFQGLIIGIYLLGCFVRSKFTIDQPEALINNMFTLVTFGLIGLTGSYLGEEKRRISFDRYLQLKKSKSELNGYKDLLQAELQSEQNNVEVLVNEIAQRRRELETALNLRNEFISLASHELNTPLTSLKLMTQMMKQTFDQKKELSSSNVQRLLRIYELQVKRLARTVANMLDISRLETGRFELEREQIDMNELVKNVIEVCLSEKEQKIFLESSGAIRGKWDGFRIEQVVQNLLTNAMKYGGQDPIHVRLLGTDELAILEIKDSGIGIAPEHQKRIFNRFERAVTPLEYSGLGLGLYIASQIVEKHKGSLSVESEPGRGSTFKVVLPLDG